jgi:hypothetical protein
MWQWVHCLTRTFPSGCGQGGVGPNYFLLKPDWPSKLNEVRRQPFPNYSSLFLLKDRKKGKKEICTFEIFAQHLHTLVFLNLMQSKKGSDETFFV